jgi:hypothetical protein
MPLLGQATDGMETVNAGNFQFSAAKIAKLASDHFTLGTVVVDVSYSLDGHEKELEEMLFTSLQACQTSDEADSLLVRVLTFSDDVDEVHGFKLMPDIKLTDPQTGKILAQHEYQGKVVIKSNTALYDATLNAIEASRIRGRQLIDDNYNTNAVVYIITDGMNTTGSASPKKIRDAIKQVKLTESLESLVTICIGINITEPMVRDALQSFVKEAEITHYMEFGKATKSNLAKLGGFISQSLSSSSQAVGSGSPSQMIAPGTDPNASLTI